MKLYLIPLMIMVLSCTQEYSLKPINEIFKDSLEGYYKIPRDSRHADLLRAFKVEIAQIEQDLDSDPRMEKSISLLSIKYDSLRNEFQKLNSYYPQEHMDSVYYEMQRTDLPSNVVVYNVMNLFSKIFIILSDKGLYLDQWNVKLLSNDTIYLPKNRIFTFDFGTLSKSENQDTFEVNEFLYKSNRAQTRHIMISTFRETSTFNKKYSIDYLNPITNERFTYRDSIFVQIFDD